MALKNVSKSPLNKVKRMRQKGPSKLATDGLSPPRLCWLAMVMVLPPWPSTMAMAQAWPQPGHSLKFPDYGLGRGAPLGHHFVA